MTDQHRNWLAITLMILWAALFAAVVHATRSPLKP